MELMTERHFLKTAQCDLSAHLQLNELFLLMQEIAGIDSERLGFGRSFIESEDIFWVLSRVSLTNFNPPKRDTAVTLKTWHGDNVRYIFPRYFLLEGESGETLAEMSTLWMLIDRRERSIIMPSLRGYCMPPRREDMPAFPPPGKLRFTFPLDSKAVRRPVYSDFDVNGHMNNARYPLWICDLFPPTRFIKSYIRSIQINYVQEILEGDEVLLSFGEQGDAFAVRGTVGENIKFEANGEFAPYPGGSNI